MTQQTFSSWYNPEPDSRLQELMDYKGLGSLAHKALGRGGLGWEEAGIESQSTGPKASKAANPGKVEGRCVNMVQSE